MDYKEAKKELDRVYSELNLSFAVTSIQGRIKNTWEHIYFDCEFKNKNGYELKCEYKMGTGLFNLKRIPSYFLMGSEEHMYNAILENPHANFKDKKLYISVIKKIVIKTKQLPVASEVLGGLCRDTWDARENSFENYCSNYGMNPDSIKNKKIYDACLEYYFKLERLIGREMITTLYELTCKL